MFFCTKEALQHAGCMLLCKMSLWVNDWIPPKWPELENYHHVPLTVKASSFPSSLRPHQGMLIRSFPGNSYHWLAIFKIKIQGSFQSVSFEQISTEWASETSLFMSCLMRKTKSASTEIPHHHQYFIVKNFKHKV